MMRTTTLTLAAGLALVLASTLVAADYEGRKRCSADAEACISEMVKHFENRGWVGIELDFDKASGEWAIKKVIPASPAEKAGIEVGDVVRAVNDLAYTEDNMQKVGAAFKAMRPGEEVTFTLVRGGRELDVEVTLQTLPRSVMAQWVGTHVMEHHTVEAQAEDEVAAKEGG